MPALGGHLRLLSVLALAIVFTVLNALKPLHVDDAIYHAYAANAACHPASPYGFEVVYGGLKTWPANEVLAPPAFLYWWAGTIRLLGDQPVLWKLSLFPISLLLVAALQVLLRRFARGLEHYLLWMTVLSPALLPSFNMMLDIPALALALTALVIFMGACRSASFWRAVAAGLVAGLAMQTKYTAFTAPAAFLVYAFLWRQLRLGLLAAAVALALFASWESAMVSWQGQSHFLLHARAQDTSLLHKCRLFFPFVLLSGGLGCAFTLLGLIGLGSRLRFILMAAAAMLLGHLLIALTNPVLLSDAITGQVYLRLHYAVFGVLGTLLLVVLAAVVVRLVGQDRKACSTGVEPALHPIMSWLKNPSRRVDVFLVLWLIVEVGGYFTLSPFPAARRLLGPFLVASLLCGRLVALNFRVATRPAQLRSVTLAGITLGLFYFSVDFLDARGAQEAALAARQLTRGPGKAWYIGNWGFRFHAEQAGLLPLAESRARLHRGDWLVVSVDQLLPQARFDASRWPLQAISAMVLTDALPLRTTMCYYAGQVPLEHLSGPRSQLLFYRVTRDFDYR